MHAFRGTSSIICYSSPVHSIESALSCVEVVLFPNGETTGHHLVDTSQPVSGCDVLVTAQ